MSRKLAVLVGSIGKLPYAGLALYDLHHVVGLKQLGYQVHYVERENYPGECYNPVMNEMTDDPTYAIDYLKNLLPRYGIAGDRFSFIDLKNVCHGSGWQELRDTLDAADFVLTLANPTWFDELERCPHRAFVDADPMFRQVAMARGESPTDRAPFHYPVLFTDAARIGMSDCAVPQLGRSWIPARPVVATKLWKVRDLPGSSPPITCLLHWAAGSDVAWDGRVYGHKDREFEHFMDLPQRVSRKFVLAVGGGAPRDRLERHGWDLVGPLSVTDTIPHYREFIAGSWADFGIAKHAYVASRCGWFSDRSICYLASGRPVLHQDTGFLDWLPAGEGVLAFASVEEAVGAIERLRMDYAKHVRTARRLAEEYFEAATVIGQMLDAAGFR